MIDFTKYVLSSVLLALALFQTAAAQNDLDLNESDARDSAYKLISAAEDQFDCKLQEDSMREIGTKSKPRYLVQLRVTGDQCREALVFLTNLAVLEEKLIFRQIVNVDDEFEEMRSINERALIHEVNPRIDENEDVEDEPENAVPQSG